MLYIDGSILEGGGQLLRVSICLAALMSKRFTIQNIRGGRPKPGLAAQHMTSLHAAASILGGKLVGNKIGSASVTFIPNESSVYGGVIMQADHHFDVGTAGAISLVLQAMLPGFLFANRSMNNITCSITGGSNVSFSPPMEHTKYVLIPLLKQKMNIDPSFSLDIIQRGWNPRGGGKVSLSSDRYTKCNAINYSGPSDVSSVLSVLQPLQLMDPGVPVSIVAVVTSNTECVLDTVTQSLNLLLSHHYPIGGTVSIQIKQEYIMDTTTTSTNNNNNNTVFHSVHNNSKGKQKKVDIHNTANTNILPKNTQICIQIYVTTSTGCILSRNTLTHVRTYTDIQPHCVTLVNSIISLIHTNACVDEHTADQLLVYMALCSCNYTKTTKNNSNTSTSGSSSNILVEPVSRDSSLHIDTTIYIIEQFFNRKMFNIITNNNNNRLITCI